ncbi:hypothetical protein P154DRAFT_492731 [Amniculicola lignicola CBS 123094]|uniref:Uncharacterized protein n=1 Tax=Amniculicola lignicola CBS 123094 TaxID=1392246 RepID=A0A6A5WE39_9PLEO|nr:hypothetical protein P154DRAFT_492731 [Amniculicola lignicola CBS 123094]
MVMEGPQAQEGPGEGEAETDRGRVQPPTRKDWQDVMRSNARFKMHEIIERLGLRANWSSNKRGRTNFDSPLVKELVTDMSSVIASLPKENAELIAYLSADGPGGESALENEVEELVQKHGAAIWGRLGERGHLVTAGEGEGEVDVGYYPRDLYYEEAEDRKLIRILLHWWLGMKACNAIVARVRMARERKKREETKKARAEGESPQDIAPAMPGDRVAGPEHSATPDLDPGPSKPSTSPAAQTVQQAFAGLGDLAANFMVDDAGPYRTVANGMGRGLDADTLRAFRAYLYPGENDMLPDEDTLLRRLEMAWRNGVRPGVRSSRENPALFAAIDGAFLTWLELRRHLAELLRVEKRWSEAEVSPHDVDGRITQYRGLTRVTRELVSSWEGIAGGSAAADELLVQAFVLLAGDSSVPTMSWAPVKAAHMVRQLAETLQQDHDEEEQEAARLMYVM